MNYKQLMEQPNNILFYENDITSPTLWQKVESVGDDVVVRSFDVEFEESRLGLREMDETERNSKEYVVYTRDQLETLNQFFTLAYLQCEDENNERH